MSLEGLLEDSLSDPPIGDTKKFQWHATPIGIAALSKEPNPSKYEPLKKIAIEEAVEVGLDLTKEETELHYSSRGIVIIFYS